ncbi:MAG: hypothetical protein M0D57_18255 [Sphingobacteriales bacterium JAD_PAG50586_3]|nr:MAG: hypothetical protein M0D57_18255 [Sphingobacteriales bacterium JAD_PAG50586_3]
MSGLLFISSAYAVMVYSIAKEFSFLFVSPVAMATYFIFYYAIINNKINLLKGVFVSLILGLLAGIPPTVSNYIKELNPLGFYLIISIFPLWQTLFAVALKLSAKPTTQNIINPPSVTAA